jgi:hypothetical protein
MRARSRLLAILCLLLPFAFACSQSNRPSTSDDGTVLQSSAGGDRAKNNRVLAGQLRSVNPGRHTLIVAFEDDLYEFAYTDATEVVGGAKNVQALSGNAGTDITLHYRESPITSTKTAVRIELQ